MVEHDQAGECIKVCYRKGYPNLIRVLLACANLLGIVERGDREGSRSVGLLLGDQGVGEMACVAADHK